MNDMLHTLAVLGPIRRQARLTFSATCPSCLGKGRLTIQITPAGDRPSCRFCPVADVRAALNALTTTTPTLATEAT